MMTKTPLMKRTPFPAKRNADALLWLMTLLGGRNIVCERGGGTVLGITGPYFST